MKKGFTLIELLAVIVILAIIALIATPIVLRIIDNSKTSAVVRSAELYMNSVEQAIMRENLKNKFSPSTCTIQSNGNLLCDEKTLEIEVSGEKPTGGTITLEDGKITGVQDMLLGGYVLETDSKGNIVIKGTSKEDEDDDKGEEPKQGSGYLKEVSYERDISSSSDREIDTFYGTKVPKNMVEKIVVTNTKTVPNNAYDSLDVSANQDGSVMAWYMDDDDNQLYELYIGGEGGVKTGPNASSLFSDFPLVTSIDLTYLDTSEATNMSWMFYNCNFLPSLEFGDNFDTSNVSNMSYMFYYCRGLTTLDLSGFDTSRVNNMTYMFNTCDVLTTLELGDKFNTSSVTDMSYMFASCESLTTLELGDKFYTGNVKNMSNMFYGSHNLTTLDLSGFDTGSVTDMSYMISFCAALTTLDLRNANFSGVTSYEFMLSGSENLNTIYVKDYSAQDFINDRLQDNSIKNVNVTIAS